jgi:hypothetical protein
MSEVGVKKYVVRLSKDERSALEDLMSKGKHPAATILKARVLLKTDVSEAGESWSDSRNREGPGHQPRHRRRVGPGEHWRCWKTRSWN